MPPAIANRGAEAALAIGNRGAEAALAIVIWHAPEDRELCQELAAQLDPLVRAGRDTLWHPAQLKGGDAVADSERRIAAAQLLLVLVSAAGLQALTQSQALQATLSQRSTALRVIPVLVRPSL